MVVLTELLTGSSSSSPTQELDNHPNHRYDVFLSFRGADTRNGFTDHLYNALLDAGMNTFLDDEEIETGEPLKPELEAAIQSSRASIIVLSKNYASSTWCLDELVLILHQKRKFNQIVIPIFYHVEPTDVRKQQNSFGKAIAEHKQKIDAETNAEKRSQFAQKVDSWRIALTEVADLKGRDVENRKETEFIQEIVADIHRRLHSPFRNTLPLLIGMGNETKLISSWLTDGSCHNVDILSVVGISGIGKTSLARHVFGLHSYKFDKSSFIEGINTKANEHFDGLLNLQKQLHGDISKKIELRVNDVTEYTFKIENVLARKRLFIVLDDIGDLKQLDALLGNKGLHPGSKVIVTTKDASLTEKWSLFNPQVQPKYRKVLLNGLYNFESLELLCIHAFNSRNPQVGYEDVSLELVKYCQGHPLALQVLGRSLHERDVTYWEECLKVLKKESNPHINTTLRVSFDSLPYKNDKELFKHIACFFVGTDRDVTETILNSCDLNARYGITNLIDRCLLSIRWNNKLEMHSLIQEMGRDLVRQELPEKPWKRSRLWCHEESFKVLKQKKGKGNLLGLALDMRMIEKKKFYGSFKLDTKSLSRMDNLILLQLNYVQFNGCFDNFPEELRWLCMHGSSLKSIPLDLPMENLVALDMSYSNIESFDMSYSNPEPPAKMQKGFIGSSSNNKRLLGSLKILDLSFCQQLHAVGGFFELLALERLIVTNCIRLTEVCESIEQCVELVHIDLSYCYMLKKIPVSLGKLKKIKTLLLDGCNFETESVPTDLKLSLIPLPSSLKRLSLANNNLSNDCFPMDLSSLANLEELCLDKNPIVSMPNCVRTLPRLERLYMDMCDKLMSIEYPPRTLRILAVDGTELSNVISYLSNPSKRNVKFDLEMSPLKFFGIARSCLPLEVDGMVKIQCMETVEEKVLHSLGWTNLHFTKERWLKFSDSQGDVIEFQTQMYYEFGIFSTFYWGCEIPNWVISCRSKGSSLSFTIPSSPKNLRGLNFCCMKPSDLYGIHLPIIKISNVTQNSTWIYDHLFFGGDLLGEDEHNLGDGEEEYFIYLSHWMFGPNEMKAGDHITITVANKFSDIDPHTTECGIGFVYEDEDGKNEEEEDVLDYYKSWNHIIGGDLSAFQLTTGEYILRNSQFNRFEPCVPSYLCPFIYNKIKFKEEVMLWFKAFSQKKQKKSSNLIR